MPCCGQRAVVRWHLCHRLCHNAVTCWGAQRQCRVVLQALPRDVDCIHTYSCELFNDLCQYVSNVDGQSTCSVHRPIIVQHSKNSPESIEFYNTYVYNLCVFYRFLCQIMMNMYLVCCIIVLCIYALHFVWINIYVKLGLMYKWRQYFDDNVPVGQAENYAQINTKIVCNFWHSKIFS